MCGYANSNWIFSLTMVLTFAVLMVASVVFLVRSFERKDRSDQFPGSSSQSRRPDEKS